MENKQHILRTDSSSSSELDESIINVINDNNNNDKYASNFQFNSQTNKVKVEEEISKSEYLKQIMFSTNDATKTVDGGDTIHEIKFISSSALSNDISYDAAYLDENYEYEEDDLNEDELNCQKCDFIPEKDVIKSKKLIKTKKSKLTSNRKSKILIGNNRNYYKNILLKNNKSSKASHHKSCLCCYLHEKYSDYIQMNTNNDNIKQDLNNSFQSYLFDTDFLDYLKLIEYKQSPTRVFSFNDQNEVKKQKQQDNVSLRRVFTNKQNILNKTSSSFSLSMSNISLNDDEEKEKTFISSTRPKNIKTITNKKLQQTHLKQQHQQRLMSIISSSSTSSSLSNSSNSSSSASFTPVDHLTPGICNPSRIESMCNDLIELNKKLTYETGNQVHQEEKRQQADDLIDTQTNVFKTIFKIIETFININKYLIFKLNNSFSNIENLENLFKFKRFDQFIKISKPLMDWFKRSNYDEPNHLGNDLNKQKLESDYQISSIRRSSSVTGSKESEGFLILKNEPSIKINIGDDKKVSELVNEVQQISQEKHQKQKQNEPKFKRSRFYVDMEHSEMSSSNLNLNSNELNEQNCENSTLIEEIKRLKKKLNLMCSKDYKIMRRSEYEALKFQLRAFRQDFQLEHNEKVYLRSNYEAKLRALEPSKINNENFNIDF